MTEGMIAAMIPIVSVLAVFGLPVAIVFVNKYFRLKHRELDLEAELQKKWTEDSRKQLEARVGSLESGMNAVLQLLAPRPQQPLVAPPPVAVPPMQMPLVQAPQPQAQTLTQAQQLAALGEGPGAIAPAQPGEAQLDPLGRRERG